MVNYAKIGVIGGTGLYDIEGLTDIREHSPDTPFGKPSDTIITGNLNGVGVAFLPRHGRGHRILPSEIPSRANIYALKSLGVEHIIAINSVGSFKKEVKPGHLLIPDQLIDRTSQRTNTFFGKGIAAHIAFSQPFCPNLRKLLYECAKEAGADVHNGGTYVVMEGPAFSTQAESRLHKSWGADVIGMTALPEAKLAREAEICYAIIACATDYDAWHEEEEAVTVDKVIATLRGNINLSKNIIKLAVGRIGEARNCECSTALSNAIMTSPEAVPNTRKRELALIIDKYMPAASEND
ncbi:MAG: S-methyl-5'-thioadenosine phosphorylase [Dehalococcoides mccartyi]|jgi:5''-deoxy-5''-methylthioadenosine phosphorylase|uniref:S-methyl-5'-thioadenosine phosphorylase n=2 Tax=root TaxID=1 RepID=A0AB33HRI7_9CHLR|nr:MULTISPECIES: S-methyl-5'-thioadenosine phosphorylase [Dehalococcoides]AQU02899.1 methylthioadenosine phosphorylase [Dehalococcoides mccartyi]AQU04228.1 methylthioadenosine phosphorylase [Dehalococcoides mccartyi]MBF4482672.1 S-methyl-5'-thioadenosine phosphorylase [Dehalococcoides mccartyi]MBJ7532329.1 S-methyl-5'-thioadenosine phosphorylase [Dehalococcoides mccartyi]MDP4279894.1 S-methyl-5'-thioadenosine phosphorylase [Dehalococcoides mccartyi]